MLTVSYPFANRQFTGNASGSLTLGSNSTLHLGTVATPTATLNIGWNGYSFGGSATGVFDASDPAAAVALYLSELNVGHASSGGTNGNVKWNQTEAIKRTPSISVAGTVPVSWRCRREVSCIWGPQRTRYPTCVLLITIARVGRRILIWISRRLIRLSLLISAVSYPLANRRSWGTLRQSDAGHNSTLHLGTVATPTAISTLAGTAIPSAVVPRVSSMRRILRRRLRCI